MEALLIALVVILVLAIGYYVMLPKIQTVSPKPGCGACAKSRQNVV